MIVWEHDERVWGLCIKCSAQNFYLKSLLFLAHLLLLVWLLTGDRYAQISNPGYTEGEIV